MNTKKGVVILGHPRSGTTLLRRIFDAHPEFASPPETHLLGACARFLEADITADGVDLGVLSGLSFAGFKEDEVHLKLRELTFGFLDTFARSQGKRRWAEKTAFDIFHADTLERIFGDSVFYLGIIRHPLDVAASSVEFCSAAGVYPSPMYSYIKQFPRPIEAFAHSWADTTKSLMVLGERQAKNSLILRYEDLVGDPADTLAAAFAQVGESFSPDMLQSALDRSDVLGFSDHKTYGESKIHSNSKGRWKSLPSPLVSDLAPMLNPLLEVCGYEALPHRAVSQDQLRRRYLSGLAVQMQKKNY
ncbi:sulfotransferase [Microbulbifer sp. Q7]|uniref:sulfotransferase family protein n=1 Tax=Microbulbifer sp. Q7 TaxID=1785091 RepID=UPI0008315696|nr:sulfotransferase [Microbulbifer sp. Q7]